MRAPGSRRTGREWIPVVALCALVLAPVVAPTQEIPDGEVLFVSSEPFSAAIRLNGEETGLVTPALLRLVPGVYELELIRSGHEAVSVRVAVPVAGHQVHASLPARYVTVETPEEPDESATTLPLGEYRVDREGQLLRVAPQYELDELRTATRILFPVTLTAAAIAGAWSYFAPPERMELALWPSIATQLIAAGVGGAAVALELDRTRFIREWRPPENPYFPRAAARTRELAGEALERGDIDGALALYRRLRTDHPDAPGVPEALYTEGRIAAINNDRATAEGLLLELISRYPTVAFYDRALVQLARIAAASSAPSRADTYLSRITYTDPSVSSEDVNSIRNLLLE